MGRAAPPGPPLTPGTWDLLPDAQGLAGVIPELQVGGASWTIQVGPMVCEGS